LERQNLVTREMKFPSTSARSLFAPAWKFSQVKALSPLSGALALERLWIDRTGVTRLIPLPALRDLDISNTAIWDLGPVIGCPALRRLAANGTPLADLSPLAGLDRLSSLALNRSAVSDLIPLAGLHALESLHLAECPVTDLWPLAGLRNLAWLVLRDTPVNDITPLGGLLALEWLDLDRSRVADLRPLRDLPKLGTRTDHRGLHVAGTPFAETDDRTRHLAAIRHPQTRAAETLAWLRGLPG
jgi:hypothetical protein